ncbi:MAG: endonuclease III [Nitrospirae bacterium]|nr:endonuclease III [Nitrospirota bacterium]
MGKQYEKFASDIEAVTLVLKREYKDFAHHNKKNPLDELVLILCSVKRSEKVYLGAYRSFKRHFPKYNMVLRMPTKDLANVITWGGLQNQKAVALKNLMMIITKEFGKPSLALLKHFSDEECENFLTNLPMVGKKVARCVMLFSLGRNVFPVDTHCWRICTRLGWIRPTHKNNVYYHRDVDRLQDKIPPEFRFSLHVNMISHGRKICTARNPKCQVCVILPFCRQHVLQSACRTSKSVEKQKTSAVQ